MAMDWVKRKAIGEQFVEGEKDHIWQDLCTLMKSATDSYVVRYGGRAIARAESSRHFRVTVSGTPPFEDAVVDVTFAPPEIRVMCKRGKHRIATFFLCPDREAPFRTNDKEHLTTDQVSESILRPIFFPAENRGVASRVINPCTQDSV